MRTIASLLSPLRREIVGVSGDNTLAIVLIARK
jgi:hypothetical protein